MCDLVSDAADVYEQQRRRARKRHACEACGETIMPGDTYVHTSSLYDGSWSTWKHCLRCSAIFEALHAEAYPDRIAIDPALNCGTEWADTFGEVPPHIEALAFWLPGEPLPTQTGDAP